MAIGGGGGGGAIRAGQAFVELLGKDSGLARSLDQALARVKAFGQQVALVGAGVAAGGAAILAPITGLFAAAVERGATLDSLARQLGTTVEEVSALGYAFEASGLKQEEFLDVMKTLDQKISQGLDGKDEAATAFRRLGVSMVDLAKASPSERLEQVGAALNGLALASDRTEFAMKLLGGQGGKTLRIFEQGPGALKELTKQAKDVGAVMNSKTAGAATQVSRSFNEMWAAGKYALLAIGEAILPQADKIKEFAKNVVKTVGAIRKWINENQGLILGAVGLGVALVAAGSALAAFGFGITGVGMALGGLAAALVVVKTAVLAVLSPLGLGLAAAAGMGYLLATQSETVSELAGYLMGELAPAWDTVATAAVDAWKGISSALSRGDLAAAGEIAMAGLNVALAQGWLTLKKIWIDACRLLGDEWALVAAGMRLVFADASASIQDTFARMIAGLLDGASGLAAILGKGDLASGLEDYAKEVRRGADLDAKRADRRRKEITDELLADVGKRADDAAAALAGPRMALEAAKKELADLLEAEAARGAAGMDGDGPGKSKRPPVISYAARGITSAPDYRQFFAIGTTAAERQIKATDRTTDAVKVVAKKLEAIRPPEFED